MTDSDDGDWERGAERDSEPGSSGWNMCNLWWKFRV